jgi:hypothetical protein
MFDLFRLGGEEDRIARAYDRRRRLEKGHRDLWDLDLMLFGMGGVIPSDSNDLAGQNRGKQFDLFPGGGHFLSLKALEHISLEGADHILQKPALMNDPVNCLITD